MAVTAFSGSFFDIQIKDQLFLMNRVKMTVISDQTTWCQ